MSYTDKDKKIITIQNLLDVLSKSNGLKMFRGQTRDWALLPSIGRYPKNVKTYIDWRNFHDQIIYQFKRLGHPYISQLKLNETDIWILGQHYNLPTRLLDTTTNPLKALFFSVNIPFDDKDDGVFWIITYESWREELDEEARSFWDKELFPFLPTQLDSRLTAQEGAFISYPLPNNNKPLLPMDKFKQKDVTFMKLIIPSSAKPRLRMELQELGIQFRFLFPDLDGVARGIGLSIMGSYL